jgi:Tol biopolymer transport system component
MSWLRKAALPAAGAALVVLATAAPADAQYFGRQKVQYERFNWQVKNTPRFEIHYYEGMEVATQDAARMAERWYTRLSRAFQHEFPEKPIVFYADHPDFQQTNVTPGMIGEGTGGFMEFLRGRVVLPHTGIYHDTHHVLGHELVHAFQLDLAQGQAGGGIQGMSRLPLFLIEGMAEYLSIGRYDPHTAMWMRDAAIRGDLPTLDQLGRDPRYFPYRYGQALWAYIAGRYGDRSVPELYRQATRVGWEQALERVLGTNSRQLSEDWIASIRTAYLPILEGRQRSADAGTPVIVDPEIGAMNLAPMVSPDGRYVAFFGRRALFTTDLYLADAATGEIVRRLASPQQTPHFDALSFIASAGTWSPDGSQFAFVVFREGDHELAILDVASARITRRYDVREVGSIQHPAWSPDGRTIAFSGMRGGISDLYLLDLASGSAAQLMSDRHADLQPTWSPDGRTLAFVTDRGPRTDFDRLSFGPLRLATIDVQTRAIELLEIFDGPKHINPQYSGDGRSLFFIADREGFSDLYRMELATGELFQVTRLATGISGISSNSPAMSVSRETGGILFSVFENSGNNIYAMTADRTTGEPVARTAETLSIAGLLPPVEAWGTGLVHEYLEDSLTGLLAADEPFDTRDYRPRVALEYVGPPAFGVGASEFGVGIAGGVSLYFSDMLGDHTIGSVIQANGGVKDLGGLVAYNNASRRWNWGATASHIPYLTGGTFLSTEVVDGVPYRTVNNVFDRLFVNELQLGTRYPFSISRRFEVNAGYTRYSFDREIQQLFLDGGNRVIGQRILTSETPPPLNLVSGAAAFVGDNSYFALTSPVSGERYRFELSPTFGSIQFHTALADYRRYLFLQPFTVAFRGLHYGRYGRDADGFRTRPDGGREQILTPIFLGWQTFVRGYSRDSFTVDECEPADWSTCPAFDRLVGSRIGVVSAEFRVPLLGVPQFGLINFPLVPLEISPFVDAGVAWTRQQSPTLEFSTTSLDRVPVVSTGISARMNILGYMILEAYYAYPFQRPVKGAHWGFQLAPGW